MQRQIGLKADILNAFTGICQMLSAIHDEAFHWGLPESRFDYALSWRMHGEAKRNLATCRDYRLGIDVPFPSWSWSAWADSNSFNWISWSQHIITNLSKVQINFYCRDGSGRLRQIQSKLVTAQPGGLPKCSSAMNQLHTWKDQPEVIHESEIDETVAYDNGRLYFRTSTAELYIKRYIRNSAFPMNPKGPEYSIIGSNGEIASAYLEITAHIPFKDPTIMTAAPQHVKDLVDKEETSDAFLSELVIIGTD
jgi:hypothetical protein